MSTHHKLARRSKTSEAPPLALERFRGYLRALTELQIGRGLQAKIDPSDIVQESLLDAHVGWAQFRGTSEVDLRAWLRTILANNLYKAVRACRALKRDARREISLAQQIEQSSVHFEAFLAAEGTSPSRPLQQLELAENLAAAIAKIPEDQRLAVVLKYFHGWSTAEIAEHMQRGQTAVAGLLKRGIDRLRDQIKR